MRVLYSVSIFSFIGYITAAAVHHVEDHISEYQDIDVVRRSAISCIPGSLGLGGGNGYRDYCCTDQSDCIGDCIMGKCNGPIKQDNHMVPIDPSNEVFCIIGAYGTEKGDGYKDYCCKSQRDCVESCVNGLCNGSPKYVDFSSAFPPTAYPVFALGMQESENALDTLQVDSTQPGIGSVVIYGATPSNSMESPPIIHDDDLEIMAKRNKEEGLLSGSDCGGCCTRGSFHPLAHSMQIPG
ncbi:hypothetical protein BDB01DRAFT_834162 [Pilobolus umbonatus]|nr:hypothetical protein BDB01DRAFT_834162 [Pilobolus umbonatus]